MWQYSALLLELYALAYLEKWRRRKPTQKSRPHATRAIVRATIMPEGAQGETGSENGQAYIIYEYVTPTRFYIWSRNNSSLERQNMSGN